MNIESIELKNSPLLHPSAPLLPPFPIHLLPLRHGNFKRLSNVLHLQIYSILPSKNLPSLTTLHPLPVKRAVASTFSLSTTNHRFKYLYLPIQRSILRQLHINSSSSLDIHYPSCLLIALLIHNDYDALNINNLRNLYYDNFDQDEKEWATCSLFSQHVVRATCHLKGLVQPTIARFFIDKVIMAAVILNELFPVKQA
ncbi:hypothetical protein G6F37_003809 [Rhizopus arrhizus]|nr:hypothetical protein G6F38_003964 [Rhizopus arrhizus]KAG1160642.1 hypothetical protein G6F37_003809 [Rhizopus arrhizus]